MRYRGRIVTEQGNLLSGVLTIDNGHYQLNADGVEVLSGSIGRRKIEPDSTGILRLPAGHKIVEFSVSPVWRPDLWVTPGQPPAQPAPEAPVLIPPLDDSQTERALSPTTAPREPLPPEAPTAETLPADPFKGDEPVTPSDTRAAAVVAEDQSVDTSASEPQPPPESRFARWFATRSTAAGPDVRADLPSNPESELAAGKRLGLAGLAFWRTTPEVCEHSYETSTAGHGITRSVCEHCGAVQIDLSDTEPASDVDSDIARQRFRRRWADIKAS